jgi:hypothetical protein
MGAVHSGELAAIKVRATDSVSGGHIRDAAAEAWLFAPGRDPEHDAASREVPDRVAGLSWDEAARSYVGHIPTEGMVPGTWTVMGVLRGGGRQHQGMCFIPLRVLP